MWTIELNNSIHFDVYVFLAVFLLLFVFHVVVLSIFFCSNLIHNDDKMNLWGDSMISRFYCFQYKECDLCSHEESFLQKPHFISNALTRHRIVWLSVFLLTQQLLHISIFHIFGTFMNNSVIRSQKQGQKEFSTFEIQHWTWQNPFRSMIFDTQLSENVPTPLSSDDEDVSKTKILPQNSVKNFKNYFTVWPVAGKNWSSKRVAVVKYWSKYVKFMEMLIRWPTLLILRLMACFCAFKHT